MLSLPQICINKFLITCCDDELKEMNKKYPHWYIFLNFNKFYESTKKIIFKTSLNNNIIINIGESINFILLVLACLVLVFYKL